MPTIKRVGEETKVVPPRYEQPEREMREERARLQEEFNPTETYEAREARIWNEKIQEAKVRSLYPERVKPGRQFNTAECDTHDTKDLPRNRRVEMKESGRGQGAVVHSGHTHGSQPTGVRRLK